LRLLLDQNLSRLLLDRLADLFPGSTHVSGAGLERANDQIIWSWAANHGHVLMTKDRDFEREDDFPGPPPKCILVVTGNASTDDIEALIRRSAARLDAFQQDALRIFVLN
jgi:predicted nuclease of predicted toxin-antitoxin system